MSIRRTGTLLTAYVLLASVSVLGASPALADGDLTLDQWGLDAINAAEGWEAGTGAGATIALLDTGVDDTHPDLGFSPDAADSQESASVVTGPDLTGADLEPGAESFGIRGTKLAGIIAASGHGQEHSGGVLGVAPDAEILSVRVTDEPEENEDADAEVVAEGLRHAAQEGVQVALLPAGVDGSDEKLADAVEYADDRGVLVVAPAGAPTAGVLTVSAVDEDLRPVDPEWDAANVAAPGAEIVTTSAGGDYTQADGSAAAAAFVAGSGALIRAAHPHLRPEQVAEALAGSAQPIEAGPVTGPEAEAVPPQEPAQDPAEGMDGTEDLPAEGVGEAPPADPPADPAMDPAVDTAAGPGARPAANAVTGTAAVESAANGVEETPDEDAAGEEDDVPTGLLDLAAAVSAAEEAATESEPFDEDLASAEDDETPLLWVIGATIGLALGAVVVLVLVLRRRWSNPYDLPEHEPVAEPERASSRPRRGRRRRR